MSIPIFDKNSWASLLPKELTIVTNNGNFVLKLPKVNNGVNTDNISNSGPETAVAVIADQLQISYTQNAMVDSHTDDAKIFDFNGINYDEDQLKDKARTSEYMDRWSYNKYIQPIKGLLVSELNELIQNETDAKLINKYKYRLEELELPFLE